MSRSAKPKSPQGESHPVPRNGWVKPAGETVLGEAGSAFARAGFADATLLLRWAEIAGPQIAQIARPLKWQDGPEGATLTLKCEAGAIVFLQHQTRELTEHLNTYLGRGRISRLKLVPGRLERAPEPPPHPAPSPDWVIDKPGLPDALARLTDARVRLKTSRPRPAIKRPD
jgi:hypothetical protein